MLDTILLMRIEEFTVEMQVHYWEALQRNVGANAGGEDIN